MAKTKGNGQKGRPKVERKFEVSTELRTLAEDVIQKEGLNITPAKIEYLLVYPNVSKKIAGICKKSGKELKFFTTFDYLIEMSGELWDKLDDKTRYILMQHELMHVKPVINEKSGKWDYKIQDHDVKDFALLIKRHGIDWISNVKTQMASVYDLEPKDESSITL